MYWNLSDIATLSFSPPKIISTGQGGMVLTNNDETANALRRLKDFGRSGGGNDVHTSLDITLNLRIYKQLWVYLSSKILRIG